MMHVSVSTKIPYKSRNVGFMCGRNQGGVKELRHMEVMNRQISKFNKLLQWKNHEDQGGHSNHQNGCSNQDGLEIAKIVSKKWVINLSSTPSLSNKNHSCYMAQTLL